MLMIQKTYTLLSIFIILFVFACQKNDNINPDNSEQGVSFTTNAQSTLKSADCFSKKADYAKVTISGTNYKVVVFYIDNKPYTNTIKLPVGQYKLSEFMMMDDNNTPNDDTDDVLIAAAPHAGSEFAAYVEQPLDISFNIEAFKKTELPVTVLCYEESSYSKFGFVYNEVGQLIIREQFFFGDICIKSLKDYTGSLYENQSNGLQLDMPAIAKIEVWRNGVKMGVYTNESWYAEGMPITVRYGDLPEKEDNFEFKLYILVRQGPGFGYVYFHNWKFKDAERIEAGNDGVVDFVLGNCLPDADLKLAPWINLPPTTTYTITNWESPTMGGYVDVTLSNTPEGYEFTNGVYASFCADHATGIFVGNPYEMAMYSSLYQNQLPQFAKSDKWEKINWLYNHLDWYPGYHWYDIQGFVWLYDTPAWQGEAEGTVPALTEMSKKMKADADKYGVGYKVPSGGWAAVILIPVGNGNTATVQTMFIQIDP